MSLKEQAPMKELKVHTSELMGTKPTTKPFDDLKNYSNDGSPVITEIVVRSGMIIDGITFVCGKRSYSHGGDGGGASRFILERDEYIVEVKGAHTRFCNMGCISAISFKTNKGREFSAGSDKPVHKFEFKAPKGMRISALFGNADKFLNNIGFHAIEAPRDMSTMFHK